MEFTLNMDSNLCIPLIKAPEKSQCMLMNSNDSLIITNLIPQITIFKEIVSAMDRVNLSLDLKVAWISRINNSSLEAKGSINRQTSSTLINSIWI